MAFDHRNLTMFALVQVIACRERNRHRYVNVCCVVVEEVGAEKFSMSLSENRPKSRSEKSKVRKMK